MHVTDSKVNNVEKEGHIHMYYRILICFNKLLFRIKLSSHVQNSKSFCHDFVSLTLIYMYM